MSDALRRVHGSGILAEGALLELDVGLVEDADPEFVAVLGAAEVEPQALRTKPRTATHTGRMRLNIELKLPPTTWSALDLLDACLTMNRDITVVARPVTREECLRCEASSQQHRLCRS
jgi:hypothetical protein